MHVLCIQLCLELSLTHRLPNKKIQQFRIEGLSLNKNKKLSRTR